MGRCRRSGDEFPYRPASVTAQGRCFRHARRAPVLILLDVNRFSFLERNANTHRLSPSGGAVRRLGHARRSFPAGYSDEARFRRDALARRRELNKRLDIPHGCQRMTPQFVQRDPGKERHLNRAKIFKLNQCRIETALSAPKGSTARSVRSGAAFGGVQHASISRLQFAEPTCCWSGI